MQSMPPIDWALAKRLATSLSGELPTVSRPEAHTLVASLRLAAQRAGELALNASALTGEPAQRVVVCDRATWAGGASAMARAALRQLPLGAPSGPLRGLRGVGHGVLAGIGLGVVGRQLLGQYDPAASTLFLLAPNILQLQRRHGFTLADFQLWVAAHEQTHALQFSAAPWLLEHLMERFEIVAMDDVDSVDVVRGLARGRGMGASMSGDAARQAVAEVTATMTLLEGHADFVADRLGRRHVPSVRRLRRAFVRDGRPTALARLVPSLDKNAQYRDGLQFCRSVAARGGVKSLNEAFASPDFLPSVAEIGDPPAWLRRVHGTS